MYFVKNIGIYATLYIYIYKHVIGQKIHVKAWRFQSEM